MRRKPKTVHITQRDLVACPCPNCAHELSGVTAMRFDGFFARGPLSLKGNPTMCGYCGALLVFADDAGRVRAMTEAERNSVEFEPICKKLMDDWKARIDAERARATAYTRTRFN
jgi:hypothetical protein